MRFALTLAALLLAAPLAAEPFNPYAPTLGWTPPEDTTSQPSIVQPLAPASLCDAHNPYWTASCDVSAPQAPRVDDELPFALAAFAAPQPEPADVPEPVLTALVALGLLAGRFRRRR